MGYWAAALYHTSGVQKSKSDLNTKKKGCKKGGGKASKIFANILCKYCQDLNFVQFLDLVELDFCSKKKIKEKLRNDLHLFSN